MDSAREPTTHAPSSSETMNSPRSTPKEELPSFNINVIWDTLQKWTVYNKMNHEYMNELLNEVAFYKEQAETYKSNYECEKQEKDFLERRFDKLCREKCIMQLSMKPQRDIIKQMKKKDHSEVDAGTILELLDGVLSCIWHTDVYIRKYFDDILDADTLRKKCAELQMENETIRKRVGTEYQEEPEIWTQVEINENCA